MVCKASVRGALSAIVTVAILPALLSDAIIEPANAQPAQTFAMSGRCIMLIMGGKDVTRNCIGKLASFTLPNGRVAFLFTIGNLAIIQFSGNGREQAATGRQSAAQPVDRVTFTLLGISDPPRPTFSPAQGRCTYSNPFAGKPVMIDCRAATREGMFIGKFLTDGRTPQSGDVAEP